LLHGRVHGIEIIGSNSKLGVTQSCMVTAETKRRTQFIIYRNYTCIKSLSILVLHNKIIYS